MLPRRFGGKRAHYEGQFWFYLTCHYYKSFALAKQTVGMTAVLIIRPEKNAIYSIFGVARCQQTSALI